MHSTIFGPSKPSSKKHFLVLKPFSTGKNAFESAQTNASNGAKITIRNNRVGGNIRTFWSDSLFIKNADKKNAEAKWHSPRFI